MRAASLDRKVAKEAKLLVREARAALAVKKNLRGKSGELEPATVAVERGLAAKDYAQVRRGLPALDSLVDELIKRPPKSALRDYTESIGAAVLIALALRAFVVEAFKIPSSSMYPTLEINDHIFVNKFIYGMRIPYTDTKLFELRSPRRGEVIVFKQPCEPERDYIKRVVAVAGDTVEVRCNVLYVNGEPVTTELIGPEEYEDYNDDNRIGRPVGWSPTSVIRHRQKLGDYQFDTYQNGQPDGDFPGLLPYSCSHPDTRDPRNQPIVVDTQAPGSVTVTNPTPTDSCALQRHYTVPEGHVFCMGDNRWNSKDSRMWGSVPLQLVKGKALFIWLSYRTWGVTNWSEIRWHRIGNFVH